MSTLKHEACLIAGQWVTGERWIPVTDPATGELIGRVPDCGRTEAADAIAAANKAMPQWSALPAKARSGVLRKYFDLIMHRQEDLALLLTREQGKPLAEARGEIAYAASFIEWYAEEAKRIYGDLIPSNDAGTRIMVLKQPVGVVAAITPWNFPAAMITRKIGPALAAGCAVVLKPASQTPFTALALGALALEAGLPDGLLNIVTGDAVAIGAEFTENPVVRKISFTGSTHIGTKLMAQSAPTIKKLSLELGGNAPFIVFDDADVDAAVAGATQSKFRNAGQTCVCADRFYIQAGIYDRFADKFAAAAKELSVGNGMDPGSNIGPLIDEAALAKTEEHLADALAHGGTVLAGGSRDEQGGLFFAPTVIGGATAEMLVTRSENFGPLAPLLRFDSEAEVIALANKSEYGLSCYLYTQDYTRIWRMSEAVEAGIVGVNTGLISTEVAPFGGIKSSGLGREGGRQGIEDYIEVKYICVAV